MVTLKFKNEWMDAILSRVEEVIGEEEGESFEFSLQFEKAKYLNEDGEVKESYVTADILGWVTESKREIKQVFDDWYEEGELVKRKIEVQVSFVLADEGEEIDYDEEVEFANKSYECITYAIKDRFEFDNTTEPEDWL